MQAAVKNVESYLRKKSQNFPTGKAEALFASEHRREIDSSRELDDTECANYQPFIEVLCWIMELGCVDICTEVAMMALCLVLPRAGHLDQLYHMLKYLKIHQNTEMVFDNSVPVVDKLLFVKMDWSNMEYAGGDAKLTEVLLSNMTQALKEGSTMRIYIDINYAGDSVTRQSHTVEILL